MPPVRIVFGRALRLPVEGKLVRSAREVPVWDVCDPEAPGGPRRALQEAGVRIVCAAGFGGQLRAIREGGVRSIFVAGGSVLASALMPVDVVDRMYLFYAPVLIGPGGAAPFAGIPSPPLTDAPRWRRAATAAAGVLLHPLHALSRAERGFVECFHPRIVEDQAGLPASPLPDPGPTLSPTHAAQWNHG